MALPSVLPVRLAALHGMPHISQVLPQLISSMNSRRSIHGNDRRISVPITGSLSAHTKLRLLWRLRKGYVSMRLRYVISAMRVGCVEDELRQRISYCPWGLPTYQLTHPLTWSHI